MNQNNQENELATKLDEVVLLLAIIARRGIRQSELINELYQLGFGPKRIAQLVGTSPNAVSVTLHKSKRVQQKGTK